MRYGGRRRLRLRTLPQPARTRCPGRVLLVTPPGSYRVHAYLEAARDLDVEMLVASEGEHSLVPGITGGLQVAFADPTAVIERILAAHRVHPISGVVATDDATVEVANRAAAALGLAHNAPTAARITRRKDLARTALAAAGLPVPAMRRVDLRRALRSQLAGVAFPCVVKPLAISASRGVIRADDLQGLEAACRRAGAIAGASADVSASASPDALDNAEEYHTVLVESFVPGPEIALEGMLADGELSVLAIFDKPDPLDGPFFEETIYVTPSRLPDSVQALAAQRVREGCAAYGLTQGPIHAELRIHDDDAWILEIAGRTIGGDCARLFTFGSGMGLEHLVLENALGRAPARRHLGPVRHEPDKRHGPSPRARRCLARMDNRGPPNHRGRDARAPGDGSSDHRGRDAPPLGIPALSPGPMSHGEWLNREDEGASRTADAPCRGVGQAAGVLMIPTPGAGTLRRVEGVMAASHIPGIREVSITVREGYELTPLPEGGTYIGFVFALGEEPADVEASLRRAQETLRVIVAPSLAVEVAG